MTTRFRLLVLDVDGTLLDSRHRLPPRVAGAVRAAREAGITVALATGKLLWSVRPLLDEMKLTGPQITLNGAATQQSTTGEPLRFCPLKASDLAAIIAEVRARDPEVLISRFGLDGIYLDRHHPYEGIFREYGEREPEFVPDLLSPDLPPTAKILLTGTHARLAALRAHVTPVLEDRVNITTTTPDFLEFFDPQAGKGQALSALRETLGVAKAEAIAMGDGENDLPLFSEVGLPIAMWNASPTVRAAAKLIAPSHDEEGVAAIIRQLLAGELDEVA